MCDADDDKTRPDDETLLAYLEGRATPDQEVAVQDALARSRRFRAEFLALAEDHERVTSPEMAARLEGEVVDIAPPMKKFLRERRLKRWFPWVYDSSSAWILKAAAAAALTLLILGYPAYRGQFILPREAEALRAANETSTRELEVRRTAAKEVEVRIAGLEKQLEMARSELTKAKVDAGDLEAMRATVEQQEHRVAELKQELKDTIAELRAEAKDVAVLQAQLEEARSVATRAPAWEGGPIAAHMIAPLDREVVRGGPSGQPVIRRDPERPYVTLSFVPNIPLDDRDDAEYRIEVLDAANRVVFRYDRTAAALRAAKNGIIAAEQFDVRRESLPPGSYVLRVGRLSTDSTEPLLLVPLTVRD